MKKKLILTIICVIGMLAAGCSKEKPEAEVETEAETEFVGTFKSGNIYEITENPFQEGVDYDFTEDELKKIEILLNQAKHKKAIMIPGEDKIKFIADFYDGEGNELLTIAIDKNYKIYSGDGERIKSDELKNYLKTYTEKQ